MNDQVDSGSDVAQKFAAEIVNLATRRPRRERPKRELPDWADRCIKDDMGRIVPNLANVLVALRELTEVAEAFAYDRMSRVAILAGNCRSRRAARAPARARFRDPCVMRM